MYKITINERNYSSWDVYDTITNSTIENLSSKNNPKFSPIENKLFNNDIFYINSGKFTLDNSSIRVLNSIPGVLILQDNKTYGRKTGKSDKLLYKCIPDDKTLPPFLVPYEFKSIGFSKVFQNIYVTFRYSSWEDKHPYGSLEQVIGPVNDLTNFYEYQLYCKNLNYSIQKFNKKVLKILAEKSEPQLIQYVNDCNKNFIEDRSGKEWNVFSIDPKGSIDFDDAFSVKNIDNDKTLVSIYIANVPLILDALNIWDLFSKRTSTIYLPDKKIPVLPNILSDFLCSLQMGYKRIAFVLDLIVENGNIVELKFCNAIVKLSRNYVYEELYDCVDYELLKNMARILNEKYNYMEILHDSHDVVAYFMILMNYECAKKFMEFGNGIFRNLTLKKNLEENGIPNDLPKDVGSFLKLWNSSNGGKYLNLEKSGINPEMLSHGIMGLDAYVHITSPIRRIIDLLNMIKFIYNCGLYISNNALIFYNKWVAEMDFINESMRSIRKIQTTCQLLEMVSKNNGETHNNYDGYLFECEDNGDGFFKYNVYLPYLKMVHRVKINKKLENYSMHKFSIFVFNDEANFKRKIRVQYVST